MGLSRGRRARGPGSPRGKPAASAVTAAVTAQVLHVFSSSSLVAVQKPFAFWSFLRV